MSPLSHYWERGLGGEGRFRGALLCTLWVSMLVFPFGLKKGAGSLCTLYALIRTRVTRTQQTYHQDCN